MNYFEFYGFSEDISIDSKLAKTKFFELSKQYHPDFYANKSDEEQSHALEMSTLNTNAFNTFNDKNKTIEYILSIHGFLEDIEKDKLSNDFLMEMMDINEGLMELEFDWDEASFVKVKNEFENVTSQLDKELSLIQQKYETGDEISADTHGNLKTYYLKNKYLLRIKETINKFASRS